MYDPKLLKVIHEERIAPFTQRRHPELVEQETILPGLKSLLARLNEKLASLKASWGQSDQPTIQGKRASRPL